MNYLLFYFFIFFHARFQPQRIDSKKDKEPEEETNKTNFVALNKARKRKTGLRKVWDHPHKTTFHIL